MQRFKSSLANFCQLLNVSLKKNSVCKIFSLNKVWHSINVKSKALAKKKKNFKMLIFCSHPFKFQEEIFIPLKSTVFLRFYDAFEV